MLEKKNGTATKVNSQRNMDAEPTPSFPDCDCQIWQSQDCQIGFDTDIVGGREIVEDFSVQRSIDWKPSPRIYSTVTQILNILELG